MDDDAVFMWGIAYYSSSKILLLNTDKVFAGMFIGFMKFNIPNYILGIGGHYNEFNFKKISKMKKINS